MAKKRRSKDTLRRGRIAKKTVRKIEPTAKMNAPRSASLDDEAENFTAIYIVIAIAFVVLLGYVTVIHPDSDNTLGTLEYSTFRHPAEASGFGCHTSNRLSSLEAGDYAETYLKDNCNLSKPFNISGSRYGDYRVPKLLICCHKN